MALWVVSLLDPKELVKTLHSAWTHNESSNTDTVSGGACQIDPSKELDKLEKMVSDLEWVRPASMAGLPGAEKACAATVVSLLQLVKNCHNALIGEVENAKTIVEREAVEPYRLSLQENQMDMIGNRRTAVVEGGPLAKQWQIHVANQMPEMMRLHVQSHRLGHLAHARKQWLEHNTQLHRYNTLLTRAKSLLQEITALSEISQGLPAVLQALQDAGYDPEEHT